MNFFEDSAETTDGIRLFHRKVMEKDSSSLLLVVHGWGEHCGRYNELLTAAAQAGYVAAALDLRGHGQSAGRRGAITSWEDYLLDVDTILSLYLSRKQWKSVVLLGHSMGGLVATRYVQTRSSVTGLVLSGPLFELALEVPKVKAALGSVLSSLVPALSLPNPLKADMLTHDPGKAADWAADPLNHHWANSRWFTEMQTNRILALDHASKVTIPVLIQHGAIDPVNAVAGSRKFHDACGSSDKTIRIYEGMAHEIYNEIARSTVIRDLTDWLKQHAKG